MRHILDASQTLSRDFGYFEFTEYERHWDTLISHIHNHEPVIRYAALKGTLMAVRSVTRTLGNIETLVRLVMALTNSINSEDRMVNRCTASTALSELCNLMRETTFPSPIRRHAFNSMRKLFFSVFPLSLNLMATTTRAQSAAFVRKELVQSPEKISTPTTTENDADISTPRTDTALSQSEKRAAFRSRSNSFAKPVEPGSLFDETEYATPEVIHQRVVYLHAMAKFCSFIPVSKCDKDEAQQLQSLNAYLDVLLALLLRKEAHLPLKIAAVHVIAYSIPVTNANRIRVNKNFNSLVCNLSASGSGLRSVKSSTILFDKSVEALSSQEQLEVSPLKELLMIKISKYWNVWYPKASDEVLDQLKGQEIASIQLSEGFAARRLQWLSANSDTLKPKATGETCAALMRAPVFFKEPWSLHAKQLEWMQGLDTETLIEKPQPAAIDDNSADAVVRIEDALEFEDCSQLSFNLNPSFIIFNRFPFQKEFYIQNKSATNDLSFYLQASPSEFFSAVPAYGKISKGESVLIRVSFTPQPFKPRKNPEIQGHIRMRSNQGLCFERIALKAYNIPALKLFPESVNFGFCPKGDTRTALVLLHNCLPIECTCVVLVTQSDPEHEGPFAVPFASSQLVLQPKEKRTINISFSPTLEGSFQEKLVVIALGGDTYNIKLHGNGGQSIKILESKIDCGPTDIYYNSVSRRLFVQNMDSTNHIPVRFQPSSDEITVNHSKDLVLRPGETRPIPVSFLSKFTGIRQESVRISAPNALIQPIQVAAISGPVVSIPLMENIIFPTALTGQPSTAVFPIRNLTGTSTTVQLSLSVNSPFTVKLLESESSALLKNAVDCRSFETTEASGYLVTISPYINAVLEISFMSSTWGTFRVPLLASIVKPKKMPIGSYFLNAVAVNDVYMTRERPLPAIRKFLGNPSQETPSGLLVKKSPNGKPQMAIKTSTVFEMDPQTQMCFGAGMRSKMDDVWEYVTLTNLSGAVQKFSIILSHPFFTCIPLEGEIDAFTSLDIPLRLDRKSFETEYTPENFDKIAVGQVTVFDELNGMVSTTVLGTMGDLLSVEVRKGIDHIQFTPVRVMEKSTRKILIRNKSNLDIIWEGRIVAVNQTKSEDLERAQTAMPTSLSEWCPFGLTTSRISIKPFDYAAVDVHFQSTSSGKYHGRLLMTYVDPVYHIINQEHHRTRAKRDLVTVDLVCEVGTGDLEIHPIVINFGDIPFAEPASRPVSLSNRQMIESRVQLMTTFPFAITSQLQVIPKEATLGMDVLFQSAKPKFYSSFLWATCESVTQAIPIFALAGISQLKTNLAEPIPGTEDIPESQLDDRHFIEFGFVGQSSSKTKPLLLKNLGTFEVMIKNIVVKDSGHLIWRFLDEVETPQSALADPFKDSTEYLAAAEIDWDDYDYKIHEEKSGGTLKNTQGQSQQTDATKPGGVMKKKKGAKAASTIAGVNQASNVHKQFPLKLAPLQTVAIAISFGGVDKGIFRDMIRIDTERAFGEPETFKLWSRGNIQPPLTLFDKKVEFGNRAVHSKHCTEIKFKNEGSCPMNWQLKLKSLNYSPIVKYNPDALPKNLNAITCPIKFFPETGVLNPGSTQRVELVFCPNLPQYEVFGVLSLLSEDFNEKDIPIHGTGASSDLRLEYSNVNFGVIRVGTTKTFKIKMKNAGILHTKYFVECGSNSFSADPEEGVLEGNGGLDLTVTFKPKCAGSTNSFIRVSSHSEEIYRLKPITISIFGQASYPDILVLTKVVDFGVALFGAENSRPINIENRGSADADIIFTCSHPCIQLEGGHSGSVLLPANTKKDIKIVYSPQLIENLDVKVILRSSDSRGDQFVIQLRGSVGVPKITFQPAAFTKEINFGVCAVKGCQKKTFTMKNEGNINLSIEMKIEAISVAFDEGGVHRLISMKTPAFRVEPQNTVLPIGEEMQVTVFFTPEKLATYEYKMTFKYDFRSISTMLRGLGGRAVFNIISPLRKLDFGICRLNRVFRKLITVSNTGNLGVKYHIRPEGASRDWIDDEEDLDDASKPSTPDAAVLDSSHWVHYLERVGLRILNPDGYCQAQDKADIILEYFPQSESCVSMRFRLFFGNEHEDLDIIACAGQPKLALVDNDNQTLVSEQQSQPASMDLGVHPINSEFISSLRLNNDGPFAIDFLIQPIGIQEFDVFPLRGFVEPSSSTLLKIFFNPTAETKFQMGLKVLWEGDPLRVNVTGSGGIGKLEVAYVDEKDSAARCLDFNMVPFNSTSEKRFYLYNIGLVPMDITSESDHIDFTIAQVGEPFAYQKGAVRSAQKKNVWTWNSSMRLHLLPAMGIEVAAKFFSKSPTTVFGHIFVVSESCEIGIPMRGKGGTFSLSHKGDLSFGDIASNYSYSRKLSISNTGSIPAVLSMEWLIVGQHAGENSLSHVKLTETYSNVDPRSGWAKATFLRENNITDPNYKMTGRDYWKVIFKLIKRPEVSELEEAHSRGNLRSDLANINSSESIGDGFEGSSWNLSGMKRPKLSLDSRGRGRHGTSDSTTGIRSSRLGIGKKNAGNHFSTMFKRRQMFFHLITSSPVSSQSTALTNPFVRVEPGQCILPSYGEVNLTIEINLSTEDTFLATLLIKSDVANSDAHEIPLTATPKAVMILCDDTRILNFYRQPLGEAEMLTRAFTNIGHKDINFKIHNSNPALSVLPGRGSIKVGQTVTVQFIFRPTDESIQTADIIFEPDCSQHIRLKMSGGGGFAKASLAKYRRFDFGHCMIGKDTVSLLPITNEGNAILHLTRFELYETDTFFKGEDWPAGRVSLFPGQSFNLALVFNPHEENPGPGRLIIGTSSESWEIELIGYGREAVLIVSKVSLEFSDCLIGNSYERKLGLKNVGDVNYPVTFNLEHEFPDLEFIPPSLVINPFSENYVIVSYTPTTPTKSTMVMTVSSPYSSHKIPVSLHSGTATLEFSSEELDFGMFERVTRPSVKLGVKNTGTVKTSFVVRDSAKPSMFQMTGSKGLLLPGKSAEVTITHVKHAVSQFVEKLVIRSDLIDNFYYVQVKGQCEESLLKPDEFSLLNLGICPVLDVTTKSLRFKNYGRFPLDFNIKSTYPLKVTPLSGHVPGGEWAEAWVSWNPSGGYELRTQLTLATNIGNYNVIVRGKAAFPELLIRNVYLDFGVCGVGYPYTEKLVMVNKGKVPLHFNIPPMREVSYSVSQPTGYLDLKESVELDVIFKPSGIGRFAHSFIVECKGVSYKEVVVVGIGGNVKLDISPQAVDLGQSPCDLRVYHVITLSNTGDVTLHIDWGSQVDQSEGANCTLHLPDPIVILPGRAARCIFSATAHKIGPISAKLIVRSKEKTFVVPVAGFGVRIILTEKSRRILESENLPTLQPRGPFGQEITIETVEYWFKLKSRKRLWSDLQIVDALALIMAQIRTHTEPSAAKIVEISNEGRVPLAPAKRSASISAAPGSNARRASIIKAVSDVSSHLPPKAPIARRGSVFNADEKARSRQSSISKAGNSMRESVAQITGLSSENVWEKMSVQPNQKPRSREGSIQPLPQPSVTQLPLPQKQPTPPGLAAEQVIGGQLSEELKTQDLPALPVQELPSRELSIHEPGLSGEDNSSLEKSPSLPLSQPDAESVPNVQATSDVDFLNADPISTEPKVEADSLSLQVTTDQDILEESEILSNTDLQPSMSPPASTHAVTPSTSSQTVAPERGPTAPESRSVSVQEPSASLPSISQAVVEFEREQKVLQAKESLLKTLKASMVASDRLTVQAAPQQITKEDLGKASAEFIDLKRQLHNENIAPPDDPIIQDVIDYGALNIYDIATDFLTTMFEPTTDIDLSLVLARPIPIPGDQAKSTKKGAAVPSDAANSYKKYKEFPQLNRSLRNAKTVSFFKTYSSM
ncbi:hypothetical protein CcCBS67573_g06390 [Chytriomyces confervae]|uniref:HYDIN/VesB/CFA65-like Ig-like domain-containing protein n=1 Tax=Chytriomyces confervae TaxID=246404 RepID=A0A507F5R2_9FUNG|nr:hypothetical protein CcCBS67573_g06390 [Chytriomyces confervae]